MLQNIQFDDLTGPSAGSSQYHQDYIKCHLSLEGYLVLNHLVRLLAYRLGG
jgi:hypothetical protein